jgi:hypothetical protein
MAGWSLSSGGPEPAPAKAGCPTRGPAMTMMHEARPEMIRLFPVRPLGRVVRIMPPSTGLASSSLTQTLAIRTNTRHYCASGNQGAANAKAALLVLGARIRGHDDK